MLHFDFINRFANKVLVGSEFKHGHFFFKDLLLRMEESQKMQDNIINQLMKEVNEQKEDIDTLKAKLVDEQLKNCTLLR
jgi:hypothetical protein